MKKFYNKKNPIDGEVYCGDCMASHYYLVTTEGWLGVCANSQEDNDLFVLLGISSLGRMKRYEVSKKRFYKVVPDIF